MVSGIVMRLRMVLLLITFLMAFHSLRNPLLFIFFPYTTLFRSKPTPPPGGGGRPPSNPPGIGVVSGGGGGSISSGQTRRSEEHTSELQSPDHLVCCLLLKNKKGQWYCYAHSYDYPACHVLEGCA